MINDSYEIIWLVDNPAEYNNLVRENIKFIKGKGKYHRKPTIKALYYISSANVVFYTHNFINVRKKNNRPLIINLWHGCGYKGNNTNKKFGKKYNFDYVLVPGKIFIETKQNFFWMY